MTGPRRHVAIAAVAAALITLAFAWATWALFLAPRSGEASIQGALETIAEALREGRLDDVRERLDPRFSFEPGALDRDAALAVAQAEIQSGRFFPYVAHVFPIAGGDADLDHVAALGVLVRGDPERVRDVDARPVRLEIAARRDGGRWTILSARARLGR